MIAVRESQAEPESDDRAGLIEVASEPVPHGCPREPPHLNFLNSVTGHHQTDDRLRQEFIQGRLLVPGVDTTSALKGHGGSLSHVRREVAPLRSPVQAGLRGEREQAKPTTAPLKRAP
jgi:hypothetical protein